MLTPQKTLDLIIWRHDEICLKLPPMLDRYDRSVEKEGNPAADESKLNSLLEALALLSKSYPESNRAEQLLVHFAKVS